MVSEVEEASIVLCLLDGSREMRSGLFVMTVIEGSLGCLVGDRMCDSLAATGLVSTGLASATTGSFSLVVMMLLESEG
jgi:uncharacterized membrane protein YeaQ/YmgE (transglycosylase-associated protein family)